MKIAAQRIALLALLVAGAAKGQALVWESNFGTAVVRARTENRLLLVDVRYNCARLENQLTVDDLDHLVESRSWRCNQKIDARLKSATQHEPIVESLRTLVLVRDDGALKNLARSSALVIVDPAIEPVIELPLDSDEAFANVLRQVLVAAPVILASSTARLSKDAAAADMDFGTALLLLRDPRRAAVRFEAAARAYDARHDTLHAQRAEIEQGFSLFAMGGTREGEFIVQQTLRNATSSDVIGKAWLAIGAMRRIEGHVAAAIAAYRSAYQLATPGSEMFVEARDALAGLDDEPLPSREGPPAKGTVRILVPARRTIAGKANFIAESDPTAARVEFFLDDAPAGTSSRAPFRVRIDLGPSPRIRRIKAIAYDAAGRAIAEAVTMVNDRADALRVAIVAPLQTKVAGNTLIAAEVVAPEGRGIAHVDFFWKEQLLERVDNPPYRVTRALPAEFGYLRVVAALDDGTTADDTHVLNATVTAEEVSVGAITFLASAVDGKGNVIRGLTPGDFVIEDAGTRIDASVRSLEGEPVTIGLAVDSSGSMQSLYLSAIETASSFIGATLSPSDRIFLVSFDNTARIVTPATTDAAVLSTALHSLRPAGGTSLWDGIAFSLQQLQEIPGRKALVVISDGIELTSGQSAESCARLARTLGIPIYAIVPAASPYAGRKPAFSELARETGGEMIDRPKAAGLPLIFARIRDTVRGQYLVSFTARPGLKSGSWRALTLRVPARGVVVRSVSGYYVP
jgi:von Willebrand factor type A domain.